MPFDLVAGVALVEPVVRLGPPLRNYVKLPDAGGWHFWQGGWVPAPVTNRRGITAKLVDLVQSLGVPQGVLVECPRDVWVGLADLLEQSRVFDGKVFAHVQNEEVVV